MARRLTSNQEIAGSIPASVTFFFHMLVVQSPAGPMARRLTTNQEIAGSIPASVTSFFIYPT
ncbi:hypothetical protein N7497_002649 [Penicillium chrysogenum]|nr:hypothetical protein N7497_002649 [Penicillium chrysogenum]